MGIINLTPDSFMESSRADCAGAIRRIEAMACEGASIIDLGAVSTRPGADDVSVDEEWRRLEDLLNILSNREKRCGMEISIDTVSSEIVRRAFDTIGPFIVNDISAGEDDPQMLPTVARLGLRYVAMHKRGNPRTMDSLCDYGEDIVAELVGYFSEFKNKADAFGIKDWILDPGLGFSKTPEQCWEILERLKEFETVGKPILIGAADKRFTRGDTEAAHRLALLNGADILRVHDVAAAKATADLLQCR